MGIKGDAGCLDLDGIMWNNNNRAMATKEGMRGKRAVVALIMNNHST
jgi:hypothetical protein